MSAAPETKQHPGEAMMGHRIEYASQPAGKPKTVIVGKVIGWERDTARIVDQKAGIQWPSFRLKLKPEHGGRAIWTKSFPNEDEPMPWPGTRANV